MTSNDLHDAPAQRNKDSMLDRRLTVLETRFDTTLTMLPNKADLSELKAELKTDIHGGNNDHDGPGLRRHDPDHDGTPARRLNRTRCLGGTAGL